MQTRTLPAIGFLILGILVLAGCAQAPIALRDMGSFHVGGRDVEISGRPVKEIVFTPGGVPAKVDANGTYSVEAMYVQYFLPAERRGVVPLLLWHGGGLTGVTYETTPDGREGWLTYFVRQGWDVYNSDAVERGRAGWAMYPDIFKSEPVFLTKANPFERFRIGQGAGSYSPDPAKQRVLPGSQFPVAAYDNFIAQDARWPQIRKNGVDFTDGIARAGGKVEVVDLPGVGIRGNSHMLMMDRNNLEIAALIQRWLERQGLYQESIADRRKQTSRRVLADPSLYP